MIDFLSGGKFIPKNIQDRVLEKVLISQDNVNKAVISRLKNISKMKKKLKGLKESIRGDYWEWASPEEIESIRKIENQIPILERSIAFKENDNLFNLLKGKATINYSDLKSFSDNCLDSQNQLNKHDTRRLSPLRLLCVKSVI